MRRRSPYKQIQRTLISRLLPRNKLFIILVLAGLYLLQVLQSRGIVPQTPAQLQQPIADSITCSNPYIIDGDTLDCGGKRIRLSSIDAPEISPCKAGRKCVQGNGQASKAYLQSISRGAVICHPIEIDHYGRTVALCEAEDKDLSCAMVAAGHAIERYGSLNCL